MNIIGGVDSTDKEVLIEWMKDKMYWEDIIISHTVARYNSVSLSEKQKREKYRATKWQNTVSDIGSAAIKHLAEDGVVAVNIEKYLITLLFDNKGQELIFNLNYADCFGDVIKTGVRGDGTQN